MPPIQGGETSPGSGFGSYGAFGNVTVNVDPFPGREATAIFAP